MARAGAAAGRDAAAWWQQDTLGGRAAGNVTARAATILAGLDDIDPAILDALPTSPQDLADTYADTAAPHAPAWTALDPAGRDGLDAAYREAFDAAVHDEVARSCLHTTSDHRRGDT
jgi:hypothetical protein